MGGCAQRDVEQVVSRCVLLGGAGGTPVGEAEGLVPS